MPLDETRAHRSEEEWLKAWEDRSSSGILGEIEVVVKDGRKGVRVRKRVVRLGGRMGRESMIVDGYVIWRGPVAYKMHHKDALVRG